MKKNKTSEMKEVKEIINRITSGEIRENNYPEFISVHLYCKHRAKFDNAWKQRKDALKQEFIRNRNDGYSKKINVLWLHGPAGSGKTEFAKYKCRSMNLPVYISSSGNYPLDDYEGQPAIVLDCIYPHEFDTNMLLKLLDSNESREFKVRYRTKWIEAEWIFITCLESPQTWWQKYLSKHPNAGEIEQLTRLITLGSWEMSRDVAKVHSYDDKGLEVGFYEMGLPEEFLSQFRDKKNSAEDKLAEILNDLPGLSLRRDLTKRDFSSQMSIDDKGHNLDTCENNLPSDFLAQFSNQQDRDMTKEELEAYADSLFGQLLKK